MGVERDKETLHGRYFRLIYSRILGKRGTKKRHDENESENKDMEL